MSSFRGDLDKFHKHRVVAGVHDAFVDIGTLVLESIQLGSPLTGAPGQPVDQGTLRASWHIRFLSKWQALISTNVVYAPAIEDGVGPYGPMHLRSEVGGWHSVKLTVAGIERIVAFVTRKYAHG